MAAAYGWVDFATLSDYVRDHLQKGQDITLKPWWDKLINAALRAAHGDIVTVFARRGFTPAQINQWDRRQEFQQDIGLWWALRRVATVSQGQVNHEGLEAIDRRPELRGDESKNIEPMVLTIDGVAQDPEGTFGQPNWGAFDTTDDMFVEDDADVRRGQVTRF